jgi:uncharacterized protein with von Willebrand factor type A (vWA) domain
MTESEPAVLRDAGTALPAFVTLIVGQLRRRGLQVGVSDVHALRLALRAGFGLSSRDELCELCAALWAKSPTEVEVVRAAFANLDEVGILADWAIIVPAASTGAGTPPEATSERPEKTDTGHGTVQQIDSGLAARGEVPPVGGADRGLILVPQYPLSSREVAQTWRYLRRPVRSGPAVELDIDATIAERVRRGVATPPVLIPRRRNAVRVLMLIDRHGSMTPFHGYVDFVTGAIRDAGRIDRVQAAYFHDLPGSLTDKAALEDRADPFRADLDDVLDRIGTLRGGRVYGDPGLTRPQSLDGILSGVTRATAVLVISDAGAARRQFDHTRLLDSLALVRALRMGSAGVVWLNPVPLPGWDRTTAGQLARHVPMFPFSKPGFYKAVDALRGRPVPVERPV